jgi:hypothetical protein
VVTERDGDGRDAGAVGALEPERVGLVAADHDDVTPEVGVRGDGVDEGLEVGPGPGDQDGDASGGHSVPILREVARNGRGAHPGDPERAG